MTTMYDSVTGNACPTYAAIVAGYVDGLYGSKNPAGWTPAAWNFYRAHGATTVTITVEGTAGTRVADCEPGAMTIPHTVAWARAEIAAGRRPTIYADLYDWSEEKGCLDQQLLAVGLERVRDLDGWCADTTLTSIPEGFVALQYAQDIQIGTGHAVDISMTNGIWPGNLITPPSPTNVPGDLFDMLASDPDFAIRFLYRFCLHREVDPAGFATYVDALNAGQTLNEVMTSIQDSPEGQAVIHAERAALGLDEQTKLGVREGKPRGWVNPNPAPGELPPVRHALPQPHASVTTEEPPKP